MMLKNMTGNQEKRKEYMRKWRRENREHLRIYLRSYYFKHRNDWQKYRPIPKHNDFFKKANIASKNALRMNSEAVLEVVERDGLRCRRCGSVENLTIHHLDHRGRNLINKGLTPNNEVGNLIIVCRKCHGSYHGQRLQDSSFFFS